MKKILATVISSLLILLPVSAFEWGGLLSESFKTNSTELSSINDFNFRQGNGISLWANVPIMNDSSWYLSTQGSYKYTYGFNGFLKNGSFTQVADLELLKLSGFMKFNDFGLGLSAGRYIVMDSTTKVFAQNCDGISIKISNPFYNLGIYGGYTGLINGNTAANLDKNGYVQCNTGDFYTTAHPYIPLSVSLDYPSLFLNQSLGFQLNGFIDAGEDKYNRYYLSSTLKGPIAGPLYYNFTTCFGTEEFTSVYNFSTLSFMFFLNSSTIKLNCEYASGEHFIFKPFRGFNSSLAYNASWNPEYSGVLLPGLEYIFSKKEICIELNGKFVMICPNEDIIIKGASGNLKTTTNIFSDVAFDLGVSVYYDLESEGKDNSYALNLGLSISF